MGRRSRLQSRGAGAPSTGRGAGRAARGLHPASVGTPGWGEVGCLGLIPAGGLQAGVRGGKLRGFPCCPCPSRPLVAGGAVPYWLSLGSPCARPGLGGGNATAQNEPGAFLAGSCLPGAARWGFSRETQPLPSVSSGHHGAVGLGRAGTGGERSCWESLSLPVWHTDSVAGL